ncbi:MAG: DUF2125 domain-containing protein [Rhodobacteraceae bacterium]|nr:DUF2125 domain-containing protein [Paracoccaceae bacterium]
MRFVLGLIAVFALGWSGWWVFASSTTSSAIEHWLQDRRNTGWRAEAGEVRTTGFPGRLDTRLDDVQLADPVSGIAAFLPWLEISSPAWAPTRLVMVWPPEQVLAVPGERLDITSDEMRASLEVAPDGRFTLRRASASITGMHMSGEANWSAQLQRGIIATRGSEDKALHHDIIARLEGYTPPREVRRLLDPGALLPETIERMEMDVTLGFDRPLDISVIEAARPAITAVELRDLHAAWGDMRLRAAGTLRVDPAGIPEGRITLQATNWREMIGVAVQAGWLPRDLASSVERGLGMLARATGDPNRLDAPLVFAGGRVSLGIVPLGPAPRIALR